MKWLIAWNFSGFWIHKVDAVHYPSIIALRGALLLLACVLLIQGGLA